MCGPSETYQVRWHLCGFLNSLMRRSCKADRRVTRVIGAVGKATSRKPVPLETRVAGQREFLRTAEKS